MEDLTRENEGTKKSIDSLKLALCIIHAAYSTIESTGPFDGKSIIKDL